MHPILRRIADAVGVPAALGRGVEDYATGQFFPFRAVAPNTGPAAHIFDQAYIEDRAHDYMDAANDDRSAALAACENDLAKARYEVTELEAIARMIEGMEDRGYHGPDRRDDD